MPEQVKIITSRRAYEFSADSIRLSSLSIQPIQQPIQQLFSFQSSVIGSPLPTFGAVPATYPPGIVFNLGVWIHQEEHIVPIRFIHFEQNRIVIDVAGPTGAIDGIADRLFNFLSGLKAADGTPVVGEPERVLNFSEITAQFSYSLDAVFPRPLRKLLSKIMDIDVGKKSKEIIPTVAFQVFSMNEVISAVPTPNDAHTFTLALRSGTRPDEHIYYSGAPLDSDAHLSYLNELEEMLRT